MPRIGVGRVAVGGGHLRDVAEDRARGGDGGGAFLEPEASERGDAEAFPQLGGGIVGAKVHEGRGVGGQGRAPSPASPSHGHSGHSPWRSTGTSSSCGASRARRSRSEASSANSTRKDPVEISIEAIAQRSSGAAAASLERRRDRGDAIRAGVFEEVLVDERARRDHASDGAIDDALRVLGILDLVGDRDAEALLDEPAQVLLGGVMGHARHRHAGGALGEGDAESLVAADGVLAEELVEVAHPEEEQAARVRLLEASELPHRRRVERREQAVAVDGGAWISTTAPPGVVGVISLVSGFAVTTRVYEPRSAGSPASPSVQTHPETQTPRRSAGRLAVERMRIELTTS